MKATAQDLQKKVTEQCKQMNPSVRALFTVCDIDGNTVVSAEIPGVDMSERPVFYKGVGHMKGAYVRVGKSKNYVMSQIVNPLVASGKLKMTIPDKPKSPNQKFVKV